MAELLGLYIILRAGTNVLPSVLRFENYKAWMRTELVLWWLVIALGLGTYWVWYKADAATSGSTTTPVTASSSPTTSPASSQPTTVSTPPTTMVTMSNFAFEPKELTIEPETTVIWKDSVGRHTIKADDGSFESEVLAAGGTFEHKFERAGRYPYYCTLHGSQGGHDMAGVVIVAPRAKP